MRRISKEFSSPEAWEEYKKLHPGADESNHTIKKNDDAVVEPPDDDIMKFLENDESIVGEVLRAIKEDRNPSLVDIVSAFALTEKALAGDVTPDELEQIKKVNQYLEDLIGEVEKEDKKPATSQLNLSETYKIDAEHAKEVEDVVRKTIESEQAAQEKYERETKERLSKYEDEKREILSKLEKHDMYEQDLEDLQAFMRKVRKDNEGEDPDFHALWEEDSGIKLPKKVFEAAAGLPPNPPKALKKPEKQDLMEAVKSELSADAKRALEEMDDADALLEDVKKSVSSKKKKKSSLIRAMRLAYCYEPDRRIFP